MAAEPLRLGGLENLLFYPVVEMIVWAFFLHVSLICELVYVKDWGKGISLNIKLLQERHMPSFTILLKLPSTLSHH